MNYMFVSINYELYVCFNKPYLYLFGAICIKIFVCGLARSESPKILLVARLSLCMYSSCNVRTSFVYHELRPDYLQSKFLNWYSASVGRSGSLLESPLPWHAAIFSYCTCIFKNVWVGWQENLMKQLDIVMSPPFFVTDSVFHTKINNEFCPKI